MRLYIRIPTGYYYHFGPGDLGSIPGQVIPKTLKMVLDTSLLNTQHYKVRIKGKVEQSRVGVAPSPIPWCCRYWKGSPLVALDYGRQLYFTYMYIRNLGLYSLFCGYILTFMPLYIYIYIYIYREREREWDGQTPRILEHILGDCK